MSIWAVLLDENDEEVGEWFSQAVFSFCAEALLVYCDRGDFSRQEREQSVEILEWFPPISQAMNEPLCLLSRAFVPPWRYVEEDYENYLAEMRSWRGTTPMSPSEFAAMCATPPDPYLEAERMARIVQDLLRVLKERRPSETWWYNEEYSWSAFEELLEALHQAQDDGIWNVRFGFR